MIRENWNPLKPYCVYLHISPSGNVYVGQSKQRNLNSRFLSGRGYKRCKRFYSAILHYGWSNIKHIIVHEGLTQRDADKFETELILQYRSINKCYNSTIGGEHPGQLTDDTKRRKSKSIKGRKYIHRGDETKMVRPEEIEEYLNDGWEIGISDIMRHSISSATSQNKANLNKKTMHRGDETKMVRPEEIEEYLNDGWEIGAAVSTCLLRRRPTQYKGKRKIINNGCVQKYVDNDEVDSYVSSGWRLGLLDSIKQKIKPTPGIKWIHRGDETKMVRPEEIEEYLNDGWEIGRGKIKQNRPG